MNIIKKLFIGVSILLLACCSPQNQKDPQEKKIDELISNMTLEEKIGQLNQLNAEGLSNDRKKLIHDGQIGSILNETDVKTMNELQRIAVEESRMRIPLVFARDVIHGFKTIFPIPLGQAATWNPELVEAGSRIAAIEATASGIRWTFAPMIDVSRDPRWGRIAESCGEDPYLASVMGVAMIEGFQGEDLADPASMAACAKHFAAYGAAEAGKDYNTTWIPEHLLREVYLPPFKAAAKAGVATFMCSFNDINGVPSSGNEFICKKILRDEWKYDGMMVSDWSSIMEMIPHGFCVDLKDAAEKAIHAGIDMDMEGYAYTNHLKELVQSGAVSEKIIDEAVRNVLRLKFRLGLFDNPYIKEQEERPYYTADALSKARQAAAEGAVLLKNENNILPLSGQVKSVAVVGPLSDAPADQLGTWCFDGDPERSVTPLKAIQDEYGQQVKVIAEKGLTYSRDKSPQGIAKAVEAAKNADVVLFFAGEESVLSGEAHSLADIKLQGAQSELLSALKKTGKPVVMVIIAGRPLTIQKELAEADAVLYAFHGGTMAGAALADLIFGKVSPSGKLPVTIPRMVGQIPIYYSHKNTGRPMVGDVATLESIPIGATQFSIDVGCVSYHLDAGNAPLFPFGYGLSYTTFQYSEPKLSKQTLSKNETLTVECNITNTGNMDASEVVQLYIRDVVASVIQPVRVLKGFQKIALKAGETKTVSFTLNSCQLAIWDKNMVKRTEPGEFLVWVSADSQSGTPVSFQYK
jgi:beta-glucosidase